MPPKTTKGDLVKRAFLMLAVLALLACSEARGETVLADLTSDWSFTTNPNPGTYGTWSYNQGNTPLSQISDWAGVASATIPGWGPPANEPGDFLPFWTQATSQDAGALNSPVGTVVVHSTDQANGDSNGPANATWTSGVAATVTISGELWWPGINPGRLNDWALVVGGTTLASGTIPQDGSNSASNPITFGVSNVPLTPGEQVQIYVTQDPTSPYGNFTDLDLKITEQTATAVPEPASLTLLGAAAITGLGYFGWRRRTQA
jgi:hypothetical protein